MNNFEFTKQGLESSLINFILSICIIVNVSDYDIIFLLILICSFPFILGLIFDAFCGVIDEIYKKKN